MSDEETYQGIAVIRDFSEGPCITFYGADEKEDYDLDVREGKQPDGRPILKAKWLDNPTDSKEIHKISSQLFKEVFKK